MISVREDLSVREDIFVVDIGTSERGYISERWHTRIYQLLISVSVREYISAKSKISNISIMLLISVSVREDISVISVSAKNKYQ